MRRATATALSAVLVLGVLSLDAFASAPGPDGNIGMTGVQMRAAMIAAAGKASAVRITGVVGSGGKNVTVNLQLNESSAKGTIDSPAADVPFISVGTVSYIQFTPSLVTMAGVDPTTTAGKQLLGQWVPSTSQLGTTVENAIAGFTSLGALSTSMLTSSTDTITAEGTAVVGGRTLARYKDVTSGGGESEFFLPTTGPALPVRESGIGSNSGSVTFTWNQPTTVTAPPPGDIYTGS